MEISMNSLGALFNNNNLPAIIEFLQFKGSKFISLPYYENGKNEIASHIVNGGFSYENALIKDLETLSNFDIHTVQGFDPIIVTKAYNELLTSFDRRVNKPASEQSNRSKAASEAFENVGAVLSVHKDTGVVSIRAMAISKTVHVKGEYKETKSQDKTLAKRRIEKLAELRTIKFRRFNLDNGYKAVFNGNELRLK